LNPRFHAICVIHDSGAVEMEIRPADPPGCGTVLLLTTVTRLTWYMRPCRINLRLIADKSFAKSMKWDVSVPGVPLFVSSYRRCRTAGTVFFADRLRLLEDFFAFAMIFHAL
jgi:hypothetical protein